MFRGPALLDGGAWLLPRPARHESPADEWLWISSMAWIESHQSLGRHPKLTRLAAQLRIHKAQAVGHLHFLWWWALDYAPTGNVSAFTPAELSAGAEWPGEPGLFHTALRDSGWIDRDGTIHDWHEYAGKLIERREIDRERKRVQRTSSGHPSDVSRTQPNPTQPNQPDIPAGAGPKPPKEKPARKPTGNHQVIIDLFCRMWQERHGNPYPFKAGRDGEHVKQIRGWTGDDPQKCREIFAKFLADNDEFIAKRHAHSLGILVSQFQKYVAAAPRRVAPKVFVNGEV